MANFLFIHFWILFVMGLEQRPGMNLKMSISAKVENIMTKIAEYSCIDQTFAKFLLFLKYDYKTQNCSIKLYNGSHLKDHLRFVFFSSVSLNHI